MPATSSSFRFVSVLLFLAGLGTSSPLPLSGQGLGPVVHTVLFYSPTCPHCHELINNHLVPLQEEYGNRLVILAFDVTQSWASEIYWEALRQYEVPREDWVVPVLVLREEVLVGGEEIPLRLTEALEEGLSGDGIDLPNLPPLLTILEEQGMLDPRYPERRIVLQLPEEEPAPPTQDSVGVEEGRGPPEDSTGVAAEAPAPENPAPAPPEEGPTGADSLAPGAEATETTEPGVATDSVEAENEASLVASGAPGPERDDADSTSLRQGPDPNRESGDFPGAGASREGELPPSEPAVDPTPGEMESRGEEDPGSARPLDLSGAVEELESMTMMDRFNQDRRGNSLSVLVLLVMLASLVLKGYPPRTRGEIWKPWIIPLLVILGVGVAAYLSYIEITHAEAACGPVGDCNTVNQSEYATLFGFLPVGILGLLGYGLILSLWVVGRVGSEGLRDRAYVALWAAALVGTLFSVYLTFLEPFVIGATCAWCLSSALIMTLLLWASTPLAAQGWSGAPAPPTP